MTSEQDFIIQVTWEDGERWEVRVSGRSPDDALAKFLRRKMVVRALLTERAVLFEVTDLIFKGAKLDYGRGH